MESRHLVHAVVVRYGEVAESWGDPEVVSFDDPYLTDSVVMAVR